MAGDGMRWRLVAATLPLIAVSCGSGPRPEPRDPSYASLVEPGTREPSDDVERAILARLGELEPGAEEHIDGQVVIAGAPYAAASGRTCRTVTIRPSEKVAKPSSRLACLVEDVWSFVPDVLRLPIPEDGAP